MKFEEEYMDVLQNLEFGIVRVFKEHPEMTDYNANDAMEALRRKYVAEVRNVKPRPMRLTDLAQKTYDSVEPICEWRLGKETAAAEGVTEQIGEIAQLTTDEMISCLKRIQKSITFWNREGGRQGYLNYVSNFIR